MADQKEKNQDKAHKAKPSQAPAGSKPRKEKTKGAAQAEVQDDTPQVPAPSPRLWERYRTDIVAALKTELGVTNNLAVPRITKIVLSMGVGKFATASDNNEKGKIEVCERDLGIICGQKPVRCKSKKSVANFKVRENMDTGLMVTLRGKRMYEFLDRLIALAFPRVKDFRGLNPDAFDREGNYNFGFGELTVFPEINSAEVTFQQGLNITIVTTAGSADRGRSLLRAFGMPFANKDKK